jgi:Protein of unknown function (DUF2852).
METTAYAPRNTRPAGWFTRAEAWLDQRGKGAWIAAMVLGFVFFWPIGLALLFYMLWSKQMFSGSCGAKRRRHGNAHSAMRAMKPSGNTAFDAYKADTLRRLEEEQEAFESFLERLREAKDKAEFDQFMDDRARRARAAADASQATDLDQPPAGGQA